jgi:hypothetical protein
MPAITSTNAARPGHFGLVVPDHWARFDMSDAPIARARRELLKTATDPVTRMQVEDMFRQARAINQAARRNGALWGAGTATMYDDVLFIGHVMVFAVATGGDGSGVDVQDLVRQLSRSASADRAESEAGTARVVGTVELPRAGEAARVTGAEMVSVTSDTKVEMLTMSTLVPVPTAAGQFMLVTCCSPNLPLAEEVYELFDAITSTFYFVEPERSKSTSPET